MLFAVETFFVTLLSQDLNDELEHVRVETLSLALGSGQRPPDEEKPRYLHTYRCEVPGATTSFKIPEDIQGDISSVESPPGWPLRPGDDYSVNNRSIRLHRDPGNTTNTFLVRLHGSPAQGTISRDPCTIKINVVTTADSRPELASRLRRARGTILRGAVTPPNLVAETPETKNVYIRLVEPTISWVGSKIESPNNNLHTATLHFEIKGTLVQHIITGDALVDARIKQVVVTNRNGGK